MSDKRKNCRRSIVNHHVKMRDNKGRFCKSKSRKEKRQSRKEKRQSRKHKKHSRSHGKYRGTLGDGCEINYNTFDDTHGILNPGADDTCYSRCPVTDRTVDELLCENNLSVLAVAANDRLNPKIATKSKKGDLIGEYMYEVPPRNLGASNNFLKLAQIGGSTGLTSAFKPRHNKDLVDNSKKVLEILKQKGAVRRDGNELTLKSILEDYARINTNYTNDIRAISDKL